MRPCNTSTFFWNELGYQLKKITYSLKSNDHTVLVDQAFLFFVFKSLPCSLKIMKGSWASQYFPR